MSRLDDLESRIAALENRGDYLSYGSDFLRLGKDISTVSNTSFVVVLVDGTYNGESFLANDLIIGDLAGDNIVYKSGQWRFRFQDDTQIVMGRYGIRIAEGALGLNQVSLTLASGAYDLHDTGSGTLKTSDIVISAASGAFSIDSIATPTHQNQILFIKNSSGFNMTINDVSTAGAAPAGYWTIDTQDGTNPATTGNGIALFKANEAANVWELVDIRG